MRKCGLFAISLIAFACTKTSDKYCETHPEDIENCGNAGVDGGNGGDGASGCNDDTACAAPTPACDVGSQTCVQCTASNTSACAGTTPICVDNACAACAAHADCASNACLPDGSCADQNTVAYVQEGGSDAADCSLGTPCATVTHALATTKPIVKIEGTIAEAAAVVLGGRDVTLLAETSPQAILTRSNQGPIVRVDGASTVAIRGLQISDASGVTTGVGLQVDAGFDGVLAVDRVKLYDNRGGGLYLNGTGKFSVTNSVIAYNGTAQGTTKSLVGGVAITNDSMGSTFSFNTVVYNASSGQTFVGGIACNAPMVTAEGNLIHENFRPDGASIRADGTSQKSGGCNYGASAATFGSETDPKFVRSGVAPLDFHLTAESPASLVDAVACSGKDMDGVARPIGAACDLGADEAR